MKKKVSHKITSHAHRSRKAAERTFLWYTIIIFSLILLVFANIGYKLSKPHVLGMSTILLAQGGDDSGEGLDSGLGSSSHAEGSGSSGSVSGSTLVDCTGPDGKHFITEFHTCQELNQKWGHTSFSFTILALHDSQEPIEPTVTSGVPAHQISSKLQLATEGKKGKINLESKGLHIEFTQEDNGTVSAIAKQKGKEIKLASDDAITELNDKLKDQDIEISTSEGGLRFRKANVEAQTHFPLSVDPTTGELTVTTPAGTKTVTVLPDRAVQNLLASGIFSGVNSSGSTTSAGITQEVQLTDVNGFPAFQIHGVLSKKLFGLFPVSFSKTALVSAEDGHTISVEQSPIMSFLESLSL
jgi:hypothetical protein